MSSTKTTKQYIHKTADTQYNNVLIIIYILGNVSRHTTYLFVTTRIPLSVIYISAFKGKVILKFLL